MSRISYWVSIDVVDASSSGQLFANRNCATKTERDMDGGVASATPTDTHRATVTDQRTPGGQWTHDGCTRQGCT